MVDFLNILILRDLNTVHVKFRWGGGDSTLYLLIYMNSFMLEKMIPWEKDTNTYAEHDAESSNCLNTLLITSSMDSHNILVNDNFYLLQTIE